MKRNTILYAIVMFAALGTFQAKAQSLYFPPVADTTWARVSPADLGWCAAPLDSVLAYLDAKHTKGFIILKDGKIVVEKYYGSFTQDSLWYWASAGKSLVGFMIGMAQEKGLLNINDKTSKYLGTGWTSEPSDKEDLITIRHQLTMTTGLDDNVPDEDCLADSCLIYKADAGTRWAYHNAPYRLLQDILEGVSGKQMTALTNSQFYPTIGMGGAWLDHVFYSSVRSMARFGLLIQNKGKWNSTTLLNDTAYFRQMTNTSQPLNESYGYLWWLNGKGSYRMPQTQIEFNTDLVPNAPKDMFAALGKNDQKIYIVPSLGLVVVRMGEPTGKPAYALTEFDNELWGKLMKVFCSSGVRELAKKEVTGFTVYPNPACNKITVSIGDDQEHEVRIYDFMGRCVLAQKIRDKNSADVSGLPGGIYLVKCGSGVVRFVKQ